MNKGIPVKFLYRVVDERGGEGSGLPLMSVSLTLGVVPRSDVSESEGRADDLSNYKVCRPRDIVINRMSAYQGALGLSHQEGLVSPDYLVLRPNEDVSASYLTYMFKSRWFVGEMTRRLRGIGSTEQGNVRTPRINSDDLGLISIKLLTSTEQRTIADYLDRETARIDALIEKKKRMMGLVDEFFMSEIASVCDELPNVMPIKRVAATAYGLGQPPVLSEPSDETVPIIRATNINRGAIESLDLIHARVEDLPLLRAPLLQEGEILVVRSGALTGDSARITDEWVGSAPGYDLRVTPKSIDSRLLAWQLLGPGVRSQLDLVQVRAAQPHLNAEDLGSVMVRAGSPADEEKVADRLDVAVARSWKIVASIRTQIDLLRERRQALITAAVIGELSMLKAVA